MIKHSKIDVAFLMKESGIIPVFYNSDKEVCFKVIEACYKGGIKAFEFTNRGDFAHELFSEISKYVKKRFPDLAIGVGSIVEHSTAALYIQLGADFIVSPILNPEMAKVCNRRKVLWSPGCGSLSEISYAEELGADIVKIFPGMQVGGPEFIKAIKGPMPWTNIMPTGGVNPDEESLKRWFKAGAYCVGIGSKLFPDEVLLKDDYNTITNNIYNLRLLIKTFK